MDYSEDCALLLSKLLSVAANDLNIPPHSVFSWTDSIIVLGWLQKPLHSLKAYVAHRVEKIVTRVNEKQWRYVHTSCNPADVLSRGMKPSDLVQLDIWWKVHLDCHIHLMSGLSNLTSIMIVNCQSYALLFW